MKKGKDKYRLLKEHMMDGYAYHQIVRDSSGTPVDYIFLDVNLAFEAITGLARGDICRNPDGSISLEGTCGLVISGKTDPSNRLFTPGGSFWTND